MGERHDDKIKYYFSADGGERKGPVYLDDLRKLYAARDLTAGSLVWNKTMADWTELGGVTALLKLLQVDDAPAPVPAKAPASPPPPAVPRQAAAPR